MSSPELYACLYIKEFPAQALLRLKPELRDKPCVVMDGEPPLETVCALNTKARLIGLSHGMSRVEVETFVTPIILSRSIQCEKSTKAVLLEYAAAFSPLVEDRSDETAFICVIDIAGTQSLFGAPEMVGRSIRQRLATLGISGRVAISHNLHVSVVLAKGLRGSTLQVVQSGREADALAKLPIETLDLNEDQAQTLTHWGIHTLGMLAALPEKELISRMGQESKRLRQLASGTLPHLFQPVEVPFVLEERTELDFPLEDLESLLFGMAVMLEQLILRAKARIVALASVTVTLYLDGGGVHSRAVRPAQPTNDKHLWLKLLHLDLEAHPPDAAILTVLLQAEQGNTSKVQLGLFSPQLPEAGRLDVTLARIAALVGDGNVGQAVLDDNHSPESFHVGSFQVNTGVSEPIHSKQHACIRQLRPPLSLSVLLEAGRPSSFFFRNQRCVVARAYGPWLKGGEWWNERIWGQEQWDLVVNTQTGERLFCCVIRDLMQNAWQMVALYD
jgi:protein ImuB